MPGNRLYFISRIIDQINRWWYFGSVAQTKYHLGLSDKYLVEAKTLYEYKQYLLGTDALRRSTKEFHEIPINIKRAQSEGKDMTLLIVKISESAEVHKTILMDMRVDNPETFQWTPEKEASTDLKIHDEINNGIATVTKVLEELIKQ